METTFRTAYGPKLRKQQFNDEPTMTKQAFKKDTDINFIIDRFQKTGVMAHQKQYQGEYGEYHEIDYHEAMNVVTEADQMFQSLPSSLRKRFGNDPAAFLSFVSDENNAEQMREMGLLAPLPIEESRADPDPIPAEPEPAEPA